MSPIVESENISYIAASAMLVCLAAAPVFLLAAALPPVRRSRLGMQMLFWLATACASAATILFLISHFTMPVEHNIRLDLIFYPPLLIAVWIECWLLARLGRKASAT